MRSFVRRAATGAAFVALTACSGSGGDTVRPEGSPSASSVEAPRLEFVSERDLSGLLTNEDMPEDLELVSYESILTLPSYAQDEYSAEWMGEFSPAGCRELVAASALLQERDTEQASGDTINFMFDIGGIGLAESAPSIMFVARVFGEADVAASFLDDVKVVAEACEEGFDVVYSDGTSWAVETVSVATNGGGYPDGAAFLSIEKFTEGYEFPYTQLFVQYENVIISAVDISIEDSAWVTGRDLNRFLRIVADRLVEGG